MTIPVVSAFLLGCCLAACGGGGGGGGGYSISDTTLSGQIGGQSWTFVQGESDAFMSDEDGYFVELFPDSYTACDPFSQPDGVNTILLSLPKQVGEYSLSLQQSITFVEPPADNTIATRGLLEVEAINADTIEAGLYAVYGDGYQVDGRFTVDICPE
jgi:hypothetical protein